MPDAQLVKNDAGQWGVYYPDRDVIETAVGDEIEEVPGRYLEHHWGRAEEQDLRQSIEADIETVRADIEELRDRDLTEEQETELGRLEIRLESYETVLEIAREVSRT